MTAPLAAAVGVGKMRPGTSNATSPEPTTAALAQAIQGLARADDDYWSFADRGDRDYLHGLFRYPAMMVPRLQRELLETCIDWNPRILSVYDPFVGSGTVMTEAMLLGRNFHGSDINPLAILTCRAKSETPDTAYLKRDLRLLMRSVARDRSDTIDVSFGGAQKWFQPDVLVGLSRLRRAILKRPSSAARRFWWVIVAEVVRLSSNTRTSTVKLHIRPDSELHNRPDPIEKFSELAFRGVGSVEEFRGSMAAGGLLDECGAYRGRVQLQVGDARELRIAKQHLLMTSPPYGDNHTTVTYGQASYLPLQWVKHSDIGRDVDPTLFANTHATDTASLGGRRGKKVSYDVLDKSPTLRLHYDRLTRLPPDRQKRVLSFFTDMDVALDRISSNLTPGAPMLWTVGDRSVGGERIPLGVVITQLLGRRAEFVTQVSRAIPADRKRMPARNAFTRTMSTETIQVLRRTWEHSR